MPCPEFFYFIRPTLEAIASKAGIHWSAAGDIAAEKLGLTQADREELVKSGTKTKFQDRVHWAHTYLRQAVLIETVGRGCNSITQRGVDFLKRSPKVIKPGDLMEFPEFVIFSVGSGRPRKRKPMTPPDQAPSFESTPLEAMTQANESIRTELAESLLDRLKQVSPARFERIIVELMLRLGYGGPREDAGEALGRSGDGGVDGIIRQDRLGLDNIYLQAKRWSDNVIGTSEINGFIGALTTRGANKGVLITTSAFSDHAKKVALSAPHLKLSLIDGRELARLMIDHDLGVALEARFDVKRIDSDYFADD